MVELGPEVVVHDPTVHRRRGFGSLGVEAERSAGGHAGSGRRGRRRPLAFRFEICVVGGPEGEELARAQAAAIRDVVLWVAEHRREADREPETPEVPPSPEDEP